MLRPRIIRGEMSQSYYNGFPSTAMALSFIRFTLNRRVETFSSSTINDVLAHGNEIYNVARDRIVLEQGQGQEPSLYLSAFEMRGPYNLGSSTSSSYHIGVDERGDMLWEAQCHPIAGGRFSPSIKHFLKSGRRFAVLTINGQSMALTKEDKDLVCFDSHARNDEGGVKLSDPEDGKACILIFDGGNIRDCALNVSRHLESNPDFTTGPYTLTPVSITFE